MLLAVRHTHRLHNFGQVRSKWPNLHQECRHVHTTTLVHAGRDINLFGGKDKSLPYKQLKKDIFKKVDERLAAKEKAKRDEQNQIRHVTFTPPIVADEVIENIEQGIPVLEQIQTLPIINTLWALPRLPAPMVSKTDLGGVVSGNGKRKRAKAVVAIRPGTGNITINGKHWLEYFPSLFTRGVMLEPIIAAEKYNKVDITATARGGGYMGQAEAIHHALANALVHGDPEYRFLMHRTKMMKADPRIKERKHTGFRKARRKQQWVKR